MAAFLIGMLINMLCPLSKNDVDSEADDWIQKNCNQFLL